MKADRRTGLQYRCAEMVMHACETDSDLFFKVSDYWMRGEKRIKDFAVHVKMREAVVVEQIENARKTASRHEKKVIDGLIEKYGTDYGYITYKIAEMLGVSMDSMWRVGEK